MNRKKHILLVEDDINLGGLLRDFLQTRNFNITLRTDGQQGLEAFVQDDVDLCILDVMMPVKDGFTLAREIRKTDKSVPIIFLTAKSMREDTLEGFRAGADDYMSKPFSMEELMMRINAILRRTGTDSKDASSSFKIGKFNFDPNRQILELDGKDHKLTGKENALLKLLCKNANNILDRRTALKGIWGDDTYFNARSMDVYITKLRKHLKADPSVEILNVHGEGYKLLTEKS